MEIDIIKQDDVEEYQARMEKEQVDKQNSKSDVLDDPVRMYLNKWDKFLYLHENKKLKFL